MLSTAIPAEIPASWRNRSYGVALRSSDVAHAGSIVSGSDCGAIKPLASDAVHVSGGVHTERCVRCATYVGDKA